MKIGKRVIGLLIVVPLILALVLPAAAQVSPPVVDEELLHPGESMMIVKEVTTPPIPPIPDIYFLADTTGSMDPVIASVRANGAAILGAISGLDPTAQFGVGNYKDFPYDAYAFQNQLGISGDTAAALAAINGWVATGGVDGSEGQFYALTRIADPADPAGVNWRPGSTRIVVWFGDSPAHDPVPMAATGLPYDITEATVTAALVAADIRVIAISTTTGYPNGLDDDPTLSAGDYAGWTPPPNGTPGQASRIAAATGGVYLTGVGPGDIVSAILAGLSNLPVTVTPVPMGCCPLTITFNPTSQTVTSGDTAVFEETIKAPDWINCGIVECGVEFRADGTLIGVQVIRIRTALDVQIDIKPCECPNTIQVCGLCKEPYVQVAILTTPDFCATTVNPATVRFGPNKAKPLSSWPLDLRCPKDFDLDLVLLFSVADTGIKLGDTEATLKGLTYDGVAFCGTDSVVVYCGCGSLPMPPRFR